MKRKAKPRTTSPLTARPLTARPLRHLESYTPPEGVPIGLELASLGARFGAVILDVVLIWLGIGVILIAVFWLNLLPFSALLTLAVIFGFFAGVPYYVLAELIWHGRTLGKRITGIRVVSADGRALGPHQIVARNLLKQAEFFAPLGAIYSIRLTEWPMVAVIVAWCLCVGLCPMISKRKQRLGDVVAGTLVVVKPRAALLADLALQKPQARFTFDQTQLDIYGSYELQTLEMILRDTSRSPLLRAEMAKVAQTIARRTGFTDSAVTTDPQGFLTAFYRAQRERLESRQLFGDRRVDKFHNIAGDK